MLHINGAYTNYFNIRHKRRGHLFQGRYKAILVDADEYAGELSRYIHLNPVRASMVEMPKKFKLTIDFILRYFDNVVVQARKKYQEFVTDGMHIGSESPLENTMASTILGSDNFIELIKDKYLDSHKKDRSIPALKELRESPDIAETYKKVEILCNNDAFLSKKITVYLFRKYSDKRLKEIGAYFGIGDSAISEASKQFNLFLKKNKKLSRKIELMRDRLNL